MPRANSIELHEFRREVRLFLERALTPDLRLAGARQTGVFADPTVGRKWHKILYDQGWITPMWPLEHGGAGWTARQKYVFDQESARIQAPTLSAAGLQLCGPILIHFGSDEQKARFLPRLRSGEHYWCQGYSEPGAGSDLAALSCRARRDGDEYVVDGTKIWTTHAHHADFIFMLVRSSTETRPQDGISFLLVDMSSPGITVRPIVSMSGEHEVNQVFFDGVRVPTANRVGAEGSGWAIAKKLLEYERGGVWGPRVRRILATAEHLARIGGLWTRFDFRQRLASLCISLDALEASELRLVGKEGRVSDSTSSFLKLAGSELLQQASELSIQAGGMRSAYTQRSVQEDSDVEGGTLAMARYLNLRAATIYGGSSEIQRNVLAKVALGL
jgi:alkylation response protein AidB-like acyl-CoA dehydrogenase